MYGAEGFNRDGAAARRGGRRRVVELCVALGAQRVLRGHGFALRSDGADRRELRQPRLVSRNHARLRGVVGGRAFVERAHRLRAFPASRRTAIVLAGEFGGHAPVLRLYRVLRGHCRTQTVRAVRTFQNASRAHDLSRRGVLRARRTRAQAARARARTGGVLGRLARAGAALCLGGASCVRHGG